MYTSNFAYLLSLTGIFLTLSAYRFQPKLLLSLAVLLLVVLFIRLGFWQLHRADYKKNLQAQYHDRQQAQPLSLAAALKPNSNSNSNPNPDAKPDIAYYPIELSGHYDNEHVILIDNKVYQGHVGYDVLSPFWPEQGGAGAAVLVNRGWINGGLHRQLLPPLPAITGKQWVKGRIQLPPGKIMQLGNPIASVAHTWPLVVEQVDLPLLAQQLNYPLVPFMVLLNPEQPGGFVRDWQPVKTNPQQHIGYALQWFSFAATLVVWYLYMMIKRKE